MQKIFFAGCLVLCMLQGNFLFSQTRYEHYVRLSERNFNVQNFDSCLHYNYVLAHRYALDNDTVGLVNTWHAIAIINLFQEKYSHAQAARIIAHKYLINHIVVNKNLDAVYNSIREFQNHKEKQLPDLSGSGNLSMISLPLRKLCYIQPLLKAESDYRNKHYNKSKETLQKLIFNMSEKGDTNWFGYAKANMLMGNCLYMTEKDLHSIPFYERAIHIYEANKIFNSDWANSNRGFMNALWFTGQSEKRDSCFHKIEKGNFISKNRSGYYFIKGDYIRFSSYQEAIEAYLQAYYSPGMDATSINELKNQIIYYYVMIDKYEKAIEWFNNLDKKDIDCFDKIIIAYSYFKMRDTILSNTFIKKTLKSPEMHYDQNIFYWLARYYFETKDYNKAERYYKLFLNKLLEANGKNNIRISLSYGALGYFYWYGKADYHRSLKYYHNAVFPLVNQPAPTDIYQMPDISNSISDDVLARELNNKAEAFYEVSKVQKTKAGRLRDLKASLANLELSFVVAHRYKMGLNSDEQRFEYADMIKPRFPYIINVCTALYSETNDKFYARKAFEYAEKSKASLLLSTMRGVNAYKMRLLPESLKIKEDQLWSKAELVSRYLSEAYQYPEINRVKIDQYNISLNNLRLQEDSLIKVFKTKYPAYYNARYNSDVISADSLQKSLNPNEAILEYSLSNDKLVIFMLTRNEFKIFTDTLGNQFFTDFETCRKTLADYTFNYNNTVIRKFAKASNHLYNQLIKPAEYDLRGKKLLIIPDDILTQISFETFLTGPLLITDRPVYLNLSYMIKQHAISYNYSGTLHAMNYQSFTYYNAKLLGVAPYYDKLKLEQLIAKDFPSSIRDSIDISPIPGIYDEVKGIHHLFGGKILMNKKATKDNFKKIASEYEILHLATHGATNDRYPMLSKLIFTLGKDSINDGLLNTYEIYNLQINAPLVVLSACNTGYGTLHKGEGIISMSRAFFTAGAKTIVMTLWPVTDENSSKLMIYFYENLAAHQNVGDAMHHAKLKYLEQSNLIDAHPSLWAGYVVLGNSSLKFEPYHSKTRYQYWLTLVLLVLIGLVFKERIRLFLIRFIENNL